MGLTSDRIGSSRSAAEKTADDVMTPNPRSIRGDATVEEAVAFLVDTGYSAALVLDEAGRAIGVISRTDVVVYDRARALLPPSQGSYFETDKGAPSQAPDEQLPLVRVADLMNPEVFTVARDLPVAEVASRMVVLNVHRLFVVDEDDTPVGVISALDLLACLLP
jgi:CBS domain-containing protein